MTTCPECTATRVRADAEIARCVAQHRRFAEETNVIIRDLVAENTALRDALDHATRTTEPPEWCGCTTDPAHLTIDDQGNEYVSVHTIAEHGDPTLRRDPHGNRINDTDRSNQ